MNVPMHFRNVLSGPGTTGDVVTTNYVLQCHSCERIKDRWPLVFFSTCPCAVFNGMLYEHVVYLENYRRRKS